MLSNQSIGEIFKTKARDVAILSLPTITSAIVIFDTKLRRDFYRLSHRR